MVSAFWHGFYPGYYFMFFLYAFIQLSSVQIYEHYSWFFRHLPTTLRRVLGWLTGYIFTCHTVIVFALYDVRDIFTYFNCQYWIYHIILISFYFLSMSSIGAKVKKYIKEQKALEEAKLKPKETETSDKKND